MYTHLHTPMYVHPCTYPHVHTPMYVHPCTYSHVDHPCTYTMYIPPCTYTSLHSIAMLLSSTSSDSLSRPFLLNIFSTMFGSSDVWLRKRERDWEREIDREGGREREREIERETIIKNFFSCQRLFVSSLSATLSPLMLTTLRLWRRVQRT